MNNVAEKELLDVVDNQVFWNMIRAYVLKRVTPLFRIMYLEGARLGELEGQKDIDAVNSAADLYIEQYTNDWYERIELTTRNRMRSVILEAKNTGQTTSWVIRQLSSLFGRERAVGIAITEMTNLLGGGAVAQYRADGWSAWEWRTSNDDRVCPICGPREGVEYGIGDRFEAAHPGCRCWPVPAGVRRDEPATVVDENPAPKPMPADPRDVDVSWKKAPDVQAFVQMAKDNPAVAKMVGSVARDKWAEARRDWQLKQGAAVKDKLSKASQEALNDYRFDKRYLEVNKALRGGDKAMLDDTMVKGLDAAFGHAPKFNGTLHRGLRGDVGVFTKGTVFADDGFGSYSLDKTIARDFGRTIIRAKVVNQKALPMPDSPAEMEWMLPRQSIFTVKDVSTREGITYVDVELQ